MSECISFITGKYEAKETGFQLGSATLHTCMTPQKSRCRLLSINIFFFVKANEDFFTLVITINLTNFSFYFVRIIISKLSKHIYLLYINLGIF